MEKKDSFFLQNKNNKGIKKNKEGPKQEYKKKRQEEHNKNRDLEKEKDKKPFDKKTYRLKKYSKKYKLEQWEEQRKKKLLRDYYKDTKDEQTTGTYKPRTFDEDHVDSSETAGRFVRHPDIIDKENESTESKTKKDPYKRAKEQYNKIQQEKIDKKKQIEVAKEERKQKLQEYKKKKQDRFKKLSKKTKSGQPIMTGRMELLLEKIQKGKN